MCLALTVIFARYTKLEQSLPGWVRHAAAASSTLFWKVLCSKMMSVYLHDS